MGAFIGAVAVAERQMTTFARYDPVGAVAACAAIVGLTSPILLAHRFDPHSASRSEVGTDQRRTNDTPTPASGTVGAADAANA